MPIHILEPIILLNNIIQVRHYEMSCWIMALGGFWDTIKLRSFLGVTINHDTKNNEINKYYIHQQPDYFVFSIFFHSLFSLPFSYCSIKLNYYIAFLLQINVIACRVTPAHFAISVCFIPNWLYIALISLSL